MEPNKKNIIDAGQEIMANLKESKIIEFYKRKNILITGASGFLGKVLLWKLLDSCPDIGKIYVLIRSKNNISAEKRLLQMLKSKPFCFKYEYGDLLQKVIAIDSDLTADGLGLSKTDRDLLCEQVNIVFHCAASVKFDAPLKDNMRDNVYGTCSLVELCNSIQKLDGLVHVSTAYSNCQAQNIEENLQPLEKDVEDVVRMVKILPDDQCELITEKVIEGRPNTYTYTKAMAEHFVAKQEGKYPISIVRPSIVISSAREPFAGWVDNVNGISGLGCLAAIGMLRTIDWNYYATSDMVPVDFVANCIICSAYQVSTQSPKKMLIYNMTSGNMSPISWGRFFEMLRATSVETPPVKIVRPPIYSPKYKRANPITFFLVRLLSELLFAYTVDILLTLIGYKKIMVKITQKMHHGYKILKPFTTNEWNFSSKNVIQLSESLPPLDQELFKFDMRGFDWNEQAKVTWSGARVMLLKEEPTEESYKTGRNRLTMVTYVHYGCILLFTAAFTYLGYQAF